MNRLILFLILFFGSSQVYGDRVNSNPSNFMATFDVQPHTVDIQNQVKATLHLIFPQDYSFDVDALETQLLSTEAQAFSPFKLISKKLVENPSHKIGFRDVLLTFDLQPERIGNYPLTFFNILFTSSADGKQVTFNLISNVLDIHVTSPINGTSLTTPLSPFPTLSYIPPLEISEENIKYLINLSVNPEGQSTQIPTSFLFWILMGIIFFLGNAKILTWLKNKIKKPTRADQNLQHLKQTTLKTLLQREITTNTSPQFYLEMVNAIRNTFEDVLPFNVHSATAEDFCIKLPLSHLDLGVKNKVSQIFITEEKVKFSDYYPSYEENLELKNIAKNVYSTFYSTEAVRLGAIKSVRPQI